MKVYLNDEKKCVDPRHHLKRVGIISQDHCDKSESTQQVLFSTLWISHVSLMLNIDSFNLGNVAQALQWLSGRLLY